MSNKDVVDNAVSEVADAEGTSNNVTSQSSGIVLAGLTEKTVLSAVLSRKAVSKFVNCETTIHNLMAVMNNMSAMKDDESMFMGHDLESIPVLNCFKDLIYPNKVSVYAKDSDVDYLVHPQNIEVNVTFADYLDMIEELSIVLTKKGSDGKTTSLKALKANKLLTDVKNSNAIGSVYCYADEEFPWPLSIHIVKESRCKYDCEESANLALRKALDEFKK